MEEEISLRELLETIWNGKWLIIAVCSISLFIAGLLSFFVLPEKYEAQAAIMFDKKFIEQQGLSLESYKELITKNSRIEQVYNQLDLDRKDYSIESFRKSIKLDVNKEASLVTISAGGTDAELVQQLVNTLGKSSVNDFRKRLIDDKEREIVKAETILKNINHELEDTPKLIDTFETKSSGSQVIVVPEVNPLYVRLSARWDDTSNTINQLQAEKEYLEDGLKTGGKGLYIMLEEAPVPEGPVSPRKMLNMAVAGVLGLMVSIFMVFFLDFWRKTADNN